MSTESVTLELTRDEYNLLVELYMRGADIVEGNEEVSALTDKVLDAR